MYFLCKLGYSVFRDPFTIRPPQNLGVATPNPQDLRL